MLDRIRPELISQIARQKATGLVCTKATPTCKMSYAIYRVLHVPDITDQSLPAGAVSLRLVRPVAAGGVAATVRTVGNHLDDRFAKSVAERQIPRHHRISMRVPRPLY